MPLLLHEPETITVRVRFYAELNDFVARDRRRREFAWRCAPTMTVKHVVEALGVPHTEIDLLLVNGASVGFDQVLRDDDHFAAYPRFATLEVAPLARLRAPLPVPPRFVADAQLGALARLLRMAGFDTLYDNRAGDHAIEHTASTEGRAVLTRDRDLLMRRGIEHGAFVRALVPREQLREMFERFALARDVRPFTRCMQCNGTLAEVEKSEVVELLPARVRARHQRFTRCAGCRRVYWQGSHWSRMRTWLDALCKSATLRAG